MCVIDVWWGEFFGCVFVDYVDEVGYLFGDLLGFGNDWDYFEMYVGLV